MELLVATLANIHRTKYNDAQTYIQQITETLPNAPGFLHIRTYRSIGYPTCYCLLSNWEDEESWQKAQDRTNPITLLQTHPELLSGSPEQWQMYYQWGFSRPAQSPRLCALHISILPPNHTDHIQQLWLDILRHPNAHFTLAHAFLARTIDKDATQPRRSLKSDVPDYLLNPQLSPRGNTIITFLSWPNEEERNIFYTDSHYTAASQQIQAVGDHRHIQLNYF